MVVDVFSSALNSILDSVLASDAAENVSETGVRLAPSPAPLLLLRGVRIGISTVAAISGSDELVE